VNSHHGSSTREWIRTRRPRRKCPKLPRVRAGPALLVKQLLTELQAWAHIALDKDKPFVVGSVGDLTKDNGKKWLRLLRAAQKKSNLGAVLLLLDGDILSVRKEAFCAARFAQRLANWSRMVGGGSLFSVACVFARAEFESWIIACAERIAGKRLADGRDGLEAGTRPPNGDLEIAPRGAKRWLAGRAAGGYKETVDQALFTRLITWAFGRRSPAYEVVSSLRKSYT